MYTFTQRMHSHAACCDRGRRAGVGAANPLLLLLASCNCCLRSILGSNVHITDKIFSLPITLRLPQAILAVARAAVLGHQATCLGVPLVVGAAVPDAFRAKVWTVSAYNTQSAQCLCAIRQHSSEPKQRGTICITINGSKIWGSLDRTSKLGQCYLMRSTLVVHNGLHVCFANLCKARRLSKLQSRGMPPSHIGIEAVKVQAGDAEPA